MRLLCLTTICLLMGASAAAEEKVLSPAEAVKLEGADKTVTVEFVVKSVSPVPPDGAHVRLFSERSFKDKGLFVVHLTDKAVAKLNGKDLEKHYLGQKIRVTGKVGLIIFSTITKNGTGIFVDDPPVVIKAAP